MNEKWARARSVRALDTVKFVRSSDLVKLVSHTGATREYTGKNTTVHASYKMTTKLTEKSTYEKSTITDNHPWHTHKAIGSTRYDEYVSKVTKTAEARQLVESGFDYVCTTPETYMLFKKRK